MKNELAKWLVARSHTPAYMPAADRQKFSDVGVELERLQNKILQMTAKVEAFDDLVQCFSESEDGVNWMYKEEYPANDFVSDATIATMKVELK